MLCFVLFFFLMIRRPPRSTLFPYPSLFLFFFNDTATTEIYTLSLHDALPILAASSADAGATAARDETRALLLARLDVGEHRIHLLLGDDGTHPRGLVHRVAHLEGFHLVGELRQQRVVDLLLDEESRARGTHLALVVEDAGQRALDRRVHVGVREDDVRRLAAELERQALERSRGLAHDLLADLRGARERDLVHARIAHERHPGLGARARDHVEHALGEPGLLAELGEPERRERRERRGFQHHGVPRRERGRDLPRREQEREVPRHDGPAHADRLAEREREGVLAALERFAL